MAGAQQGAPKCLFGVYPREQPLKFEQPAERRVTAQPPVGLQAADLLGSPAERDLCAVDGIAESGDDRDQLFPVMLNLGAEFSKDGAELAPLVLRCRSAHEFHASSSARKVVIQIDRERIGRKQCRLIHILDLPTTAPSRNLDDSRRASTRVARNPRSHWRSDRHATREARGSTIKCSARYPTASGVDRAGGLGVRGAESGSTHRVPHAVEGGSCRGLPLLREPWIPL